MKLWLHFVNPAGSWKFQHLWFANRAVPRSHRKHAIIYVCIHSHISIHLFLPVFTSNVMMCPRHQLSARNFMMQLRMEGLQYLGWQAANVVLCSYDEGALAHVIQLLQLVMMCNDVRAHTAHLCSASIYAICRMPRLINDDPSMIHPRSEQRL